MSILDNAQALKGHPVVGAGAVPEAGLLWAVALAQVCWE